MSNHERRLRKLEESLRPPPAGQCSACAHRPPNIGRWFRKDSLDAEPVQIERCGGKGETPEDDGKPCPVCGWEPNETHFIEQVINSREEYERHLAQEAQGHSEKDAPLGDPDHA